MSNFLQRSAFSFNFPKKTYVKSSVLSGLSMVGTYLLTNSPLHASMIGSMIMYGSLHMYPLKQDWFSFLKKEKITPVSPPPGLTKKEVSFGVNVGAGFGSLALLANMTPLREMDWDSKLEIFKLFGLYSAGVGFGFMKQRDVVMDMFSNKKETKNLFEYFITGKTSEEKTTLDGEIAKTEFVLSKNTEPLTKLYDLWQNPSTQRKQPLHLQQAYMLRNQNLPKLQQLVLNHEFTFPEAKEYVNNLYYASFDQSNSFKEKLALGLYAHFTNKPESEELLKNLVDSLHSKALLVESRKSYSQEIATFTSPDMQAKDVAALFFKQYSSDIPSLRDKFLLSKIIEKDFRTLVGVSSASPFYFNTFNNEAEYYEFRFRFPTAFDLIQQQTPEDAVALVQRIMQKRNYLVSSMNTQSEVLLTDQNLDEKYVQHAVDKQITQATVDLVKQHDPSFTEPVTDNHLENVEVDQFYSVDIFIDKENKGRVSRFVDNATTIEHLASVLPQKYIRQLRQWYIQKEVIESGLPSSQALDMYAQAVALRRDAFLSAWKDRERESAWRVPLLASVASFFEEHTDLPWYQMQHEHTRRLQSLLVEGRL